MAENPRMENNTLEERYDIVKIQVKAENSEIKIFSIFRALAKKYAPNFAASFAHPSVALVEIRGVSAETMDAFAGWLRACWYQENRGESEPRWDVLGPTVKYSKTGNPIYWNGATVRDLSTAAIDLFIFAEAYDIPRLRRGALDRLVADFSLVGAAITRAYNNTDSQSPLRKVLVDGYHLNRYFQGGVFLRYSLLGLPQDYLIDIAVRVHEVPNSYRSSSTYVGLVYCDYHEHENEEERARCLTRILAK